MGRQLKARVVVQNCNEHKTVALSDVLPGNLIQKTKQTSYPKISLISHNWPINFVYESEILPEST